MKTSLPKIVSSEEFAELVDLTPRHLRNIASVGAVTFAGRGKIALKSSIRGLVEHAKRSADRDAEAASRAALNDIRRRREEARLAILSGEYIEIAEAEAWIDEVIATMRTGLEAMPARVAGTDWALRRKIETERDAALEAASQKFAKLANAAQEKRQ